jgi:HEAT repeat protein
VLGAIGKSTENVVGPLVEIFKNDDNEVTRMSAVSALQHVGPLASVIQAFITGLNSEYSDVRVQSAQSLGYFGETAKETLPDNIISLLQQVVEEDPIKDVRGAASFAIERIEGKIKLHRGS